MASMALANAAFSIHGIEKIPLNGIVSADSPYNDTGFFIELVFSVFPIQA